MLQSWNLPVDFTDWYRPQEEIEMVKPPNVA
jgi:hypothetical protein